jgi:class 3 adenylate cyclase
VTRYAKSGDVSVAYQVTGEGDVDLIWAPGTASHLDLDWEWPPRAGLLERIGAFSRLIRFDKRGTGLSDRVTDAATLEERTDDIRAVLDAVGSERPVVLGASEGANMACLFAATYPERTRALVIWGGQARWIRTEDYPWGQTRQEAEYEIASLAQHGVTAEYLTGAGAGLGRGDDPLIEWWLRYARASASPAAIAALERMNLDIDTRDILPSITAPTLVMNRTGDPVAHVDAARDLASRIPGARFIEYPGDTHAMIAGDTERILADLEEFATGIRPAPTSQRVLSTVLFTDIVGSTERAAELGDARWSELLQQHHAIARAELVRFAGHEVDNAGDGFFATFDGPARAVRCARAIELGVQRLGIDVRAGVHTGECELVGEKVGGIAVHIGARVASLAAPSEVLVSSTVKDLVTGSGLAFEDRGIHALKGVPDQWRLFSLVDDR